MPQKLLFFTFLIISIVKVSISYNYRPQYHFSAPRGWLSDPNGLVYYKGEYHLFYQAYPEEPIAGSRHWGHAVSTNLITWTSAGTPIAPDSLGTIMSGSAVVDTKNTAGFKHKGVVGGNDVIVAMFTHYKPFGNHQVQSLAYSTDKGRTFTKYSGNPVIPNPKKEPHIRDPKVFMYGNTWILALAVSDVIRFYSSKDLKTWIQLSEFGTGYGSHGGVWECPDLFPLNYESREQLWVLIVSIDASRPEGGPNMGSATQYFIGSFDGKQFMTNQKETLWLDWGPDNYAIISFNGMTDGRVVVIGWLSNWMYCRYLPTRIDGWTGQMTLPRELSLKAVDGKPRLVSKPIVETSMLMKSKVGHVAKKTIKAGQKLVVPTGGNHLLHVKMVLNIKNVKAMVNVCFSNAVSQEICVGYDNVKNRIKIDRRKSGGDVDSLMYGLSDSFFRVSYATREIKDSNISFEMFLDSSSIEVFADEGLTNMAALFFPDQPYTKMDIRHMGAAKSPAVTVVSTEVWSMHSTNELKNGISRGGLSPPPPRNVSPSKLRKSSAGSTSKSSKPKSGGILHKFLRRKS